MNKEKCRIGYILSLYFYEKKGDVLYENIELMVGVIEGDGMGEVWNCLNF